MTFENSTRKLKTLAAVGLVAASVADVAHAADLPSGRPAPVYAAPAPAPAYSWTGFYAGLNVGGGFSAANAFNSYLGGNGGRASGVVGGGQAGYNYQVAPGFVVGIEDDFQASGLSTSDNGASATRVKTPFFATGRARAGFTLLDSQLLVYGTGGLATGEVDDAGFDKLRFGPTGGAGVEWAFMPNWSAKIEYLYTDLVKDAQNDGLPNRHQQFSTIRLGVNYHFNLF